MADRDQPRPHRARVRREDALAELRDLVLVQGAHVADGWRATLVDAARGRMLVVPPAATLTRGIALGPVDLFATGRAGLVEVAGDVVALDDSVATLRLDLTTAAFDQRRSASRVRLALPVRGRAVDGGLAWAGSTHSISSAGALAHVDAELAAGSHHRVAIAIDGTELELHATAGPARDGSTTLRFDELAAPTRRALAVALLRAGRRRAA